MSWNWSVFCNDTISGQYVPGCLASLSQGSTSTYLNWILTAWGWTMWVALSSLVVALVTGIIVGTLRTLPDQPWVVRSGNAWVELFRNIPLLVQLFLWYFVIPEFFPLLKQLPPMILVVMAIGFFTSARVAELVRAGIQSLPQGQRQAGMALGFTTTQTYRLVLLPMALRIVVPPLTSEAMNVIKNSSVAFAVSIAELTFFARQAGEETSAPIEMYMAVTVLYALSAYAINKIMRIIERRVRVPGFVSSDAAH